jgi:hypothetical protein
MFLREAGLAELFGQTNQNISLHIINCFKDKELNENSAVKESLIVQKKVIEA